MVYYDFLKPIYAHQKSFYNKAYISVYDNNDFKYYYLFCDNLKQGFCKVAQITIDKKHVAKNRYAITTDKSLLDSVTYKHICDFIYQFYEHKTTKNKLFTRDRIVKKRLLKYALELV